MAHPSREIQMLCLFLLKKLKTTLRWLSRTRRMSVVGLGTTHPNTKLAVGSRFNPTRLMGRSKRMFVCAHTRTHLHAWHWGKADLLLRLDVFWTIALGRLINVNCSMMWSKVRFGCFSRAEWWVQLFFSAVVGGISALRYNNKLFGIEQIHRKHCFLFRCKRQID